jgi:hypothetical protein
MAKIASRFIPPADEPYELAKWKGCRERDIDARRTARALD